MNQVHLLVNYEYGCEVVGAFTDKALAEEYVACLCENKCERCESFEASGKHCPCHDLDSWSVALDEPSFIQQSENSPANTNLNEVHVLSNGFGEILGAFTDKAWLEKSVAYPPEDKCQYCEYFESRGEICPYRQSFIDTVALDNPNLIQNCKERIAQVSAGIRESNKPVEQGLG